MVLLKVFQPSVSAGCHCTWNCALVGTGPLHEHRVVRADDVRNPGRWRFVGGEHDSSRRIIHLESDCRDVVVVVVAIVVASVAATPPAFPVAVRISLDADRIDAGRPPPRVEHRHRHVIRRVWRQVRDRDMDLGPKYLSRILVQGDRTGGVGTRAVRSRIQGERPLAGGCRRRRAEDDGHRDNEKGRHGEAPRDLHRTSPREQPGGS